MKRNVFFSFRYKYDNWRANIVRNSWVTKDRDAQGFFDSADWEKVKRNSDVAIKKWIDNQINGTSVTIVLIGQDTANRKWIEYEIVSSFKKGNGLFGIYIHKIKNQFGFASSKGKNPFDYLQIVDGDNKIPFCDIFHVYDWISDNGYQNINKWIERAAYDIGRK